MLDQRFFCEREQELRVEVLIGIMYFLEYLKVPLLFILYINLLVDKTGDSDIFLYTDDVKLFKMIKSYDEKTLQKRIDTIYDWSNI